MSGRNLLASTLVACLLAGGFLGAAPVANAEPGGQSFAKSGKSTKSARNANSARNHVIKSKRRGRRVRIHLPIGPAYVYYDYPYYYSRGYYPTHIGGYVYYPHYFYRNDYPRYGDPGSFRRQRPHSN
jgi:hypothetical protein